MLSSSQLPRDDTGFPRGVYRLRMGELTETYPGAAFRDGVAEHVDGRHVARLAEAFGPELVIEPGDADTAEACARLVYETTGDGALAKRLRALHRRQRRAAPRKSRRKKKTS